MMESGSSVEDWEGFRDQLEQAGRMIARVAGFLREGQGDREELAGFLDTLSELVGTTLRNTVVITRGGTDA